MRSERTAEDGRDRWGRAAFLMILLLTPLAWFFRFVQDDAFISFRYAEHFAGGHGLVFNVGHAPVEGYTNFLWTVLLGLPHLAGLSPIVFVYVVGMVLFLLTLWGTYRLGRTLFDHPAPAIVGVLLAGTNFSFVSYATGGLETMLQTALVVWVYVLVAGAWRDGRLGVGHAIAIAMLTAMAGMTRMDSAILLVPAGAMCALMAGRSVRVWLGLALPVLLLFVPWLLWKSDFYGGLLPNTFRAKAGTGWSPVRGAWYLVCFALSYGVPLLALGYLRKRPLRGVSARVLFVWVLIAPIAMWSAYIVYTGGDFMEFRFIVPIIPLGMLLLAAPTAAMSVPVRTALVLVALAFSAAHWQFFDRSPLKRGLESIHDLESNLTDPETGWSALGRRLHDDLWSDAPEFCPVIALTPAGAIGYYSELPVVDMIGLNDRDIARDGVFLSNRAGHRKIATVKMLDGKGVDLIIGHPQAWDGALLVGGRMPLAALDPIFLTRGVPDPESLPAGARVVVFPSTADDNGPRVYAIQMRPHVEIDNFVALGVWSAYDIGPAVEASPMGE